MISNRQRAQFIFPIALFVSLLALAVVISLANAAVEVTTFTATGNDEVIVLAWHTESEIDTLGFNVWRSETEYTLLEMIEEADELFDTEIVNINLIPSTGDSTSPADYELIDDFVDENTIYYYFLEEIPSNVPPGVTDLAFVMGPVAGALTSGSNVNLPTSTPVVNATATPTATATASASAATPTATPQPGNPTATPTEIATLAAQQTNPTETPVLPAAADDTTRNGAAYPAPVTDNGTTPVAVAAVDSADDTTLAAASGSVDTTTPADNQPSTLGSAESGAQPVVIGDGENAADQVSDVTNTTDDASQSSSQRTTVLIMAIAVVAVLTLLAGATLIILLRRDGTS
jgi:hypothetical protein